MGSKTLRIPWRGFAPRRQSPRLPYLRAYGVRPGLAVRARAEAPLLAAVHPIVAAVRARVIFRKVTNGFRAEWSAKIYAASASVVATGRLHAMTALAALSAALAGKPIIQTA